MSVVPALFLGLLAMIVAAGLTYAVRAGGLDGLVSWVLYALIATPVVALAASLVSGIVPVVLGVAGLLAPSAFVVIALDVAFAGTEAAGPVATTRGGFLVSSLRFSDAWPIPSRARAVGVTRRGRMGRPIVTEIAVAPVVPFSWTPDQPVTAWAVAEGRTPPEGWTRREGRMVLLLPDDRVDEAVAEAARQGRFTSRPGAPVGLWVTGEEDPTRDAATTLAMVAGGGAVAWVLAVMIGGWRREAD